MRSRKGRQGMRRRNRAFEKQRRGHRELPRNHPRSPMQTAVKKSFLFVSIVVAACGSEPPAQSPVAQSAPTPAEPTPTEAPPPAEADASAPNTPPPTTASADAGAPAEPKGFEFPKG